MVIEQQKCWTSLSEYSSSFLFSIRPWLQWIKKVQWWFIYPIKNYECQHLVSSIDYQNCNRSVFFSSSIGVRQRRTENPLRERLLVRKFILQLESYFQQQQSLMMTTEHEHMEIDQVKRRKKIHSKNLLFFASGNRRGRWLIIFVNAVFLFVHQQIAVFVLVRFLSL